MTRDRGYDCAVILSAVLAPIFFAFGVLFLVGATPLYMPPGVGSIVLAASGLVSLVVGVGLALFAGKLLRETGRIG